MSAAAPNGWDPDAFRSALQAELDTFLDAQAELLAPLGPDADRTRSQWDGEQTRMLQAVSQSLRDFSQLIKTQAQDQEQASN